MQDSENTRCTACGGTRGVELIRLEDGSYRQCADCGLIFASPMPKDLESYNEELFTGRLEYYAAKVRGQRRDNRERLKRFRRYRKTAHLLEIGCNAGAALDVARQMGWSVQGVEPCVSASTYARRELGLSVFAGTVEAAAFPDNHFDVVFTNDVLEHLSNPLSVLRECRRILRPGGVFYADTVNWDSLTRRLLGAHWEYLRPKSHVHLYTPRNVISLCEQAGLEHVKTWTTGLRVHARSSDGFKCPWYVRLFKTPLLLMVRGIDKGDHIKFLARKPEAGDA
jgi:2-polyprenyl-3-methyl-5-hydroxy-6-metoxy-1,4-benzoquinol methylase